MTLDEALKLSDGLYEGIPEDIYHAIPYFSASYARQLIVNPASAKVPIDESKAMLIGTAVHALQLEGRDAFNKRFVFLPADAPKKPTDIQRNAAKPSPETVAAIRWWDLFESGSKGKIVMAADDRLIIEGAVNAVNNHPCVLKRGMFSGKMKEVTIIYTDQLTGIRIKSRLDCLSDTTIDDLKTTSDASAIGFQRSIHKYGYFVQAGSYSLAAASAGIEISKVRLCAVGTKPPFPVLVGEFSQEYLNIGQMEFCRALNIEAECRELNMWPNITIPQSLPSLFAIYNPDGTVRADDDIYEVFEPPGWLA
jgi:hypothetical protein